MSDSARRATVYRFWGSTVSECLRKVAQHLDDMGAGYDVHGLVIERDEELFSVSVTLLDNDW